MMGAKWTIDSSFETHLQNNNVCYSVPQLELAKCLVAHSFAEHVFFMNSGTEADEADIKFARKFQRSSHPNDPPVEFIAFSNSFHGRTMGALALSSKEHYRSPFEPIMPGVTFVEYGNIIRRTGHLWAHEAYSIYPDIMMLAKPLAGGLPIGAVLLTERVASSINFGDYGSTFAGSPLVCNAAIDVLDKISKPRFLAGVSKKGQYFKELLVEKLGGNRHVKEIRGIGLIIGIELDVSTTPLVDACRNSGLLVLTAGKGNVVRLVAPLVISGQELSTATQILLDCLPVLDESN